MLNKLAIAISGISFAILAMPIPSAAVEPVDSTQAILSTEQVNGGITGLKITKLEELPISNDPNDTHRIEITIEGHFIHEGWTLLFNKSVIPIKSIIQTDEMSGFFSVNIPLLAADLQGSFFAVGPMGEIEELKIFAIIPGLFDKYRYTVAAGATFSSYNQTNIFPVQEFGGALLLRAGWTLNRFFDFDASVISTVTPSLFNISANSVFRYIPGFLRARQSAWTFGFEGGGYYDTMILPQQFGFQNVYGPQFGFRFTKTLRRADVISFRALGGGVFSSGVLPLQNMDLQFTAGWEHPLRGGHPLRASLRFEDLNLNISGTSITYSNFSLMVGYGF